MNRFLAFLRNDLKAWRNFFRDAPLFNVCHTQYKKTALISYITTPFKTPPSITHTNLQEALALAEILKELQFNVDVMQYDDNSQLDYSPYSLIIGFGEPLINSYYATTTPSNCIRIYYGTGMHVNFQNHETLKRIKEVHAKTGLWFPSAGRIVDKAWSIQTTLVDAIITFGEDLLVESYAKYFSGPIYKIPVTSYEITSGEDMVNARDYTQARKHFYWQGGTQGSIHRSLDLLLEYFDKHPDLHLHIATSFAAEREFEKYYTPLLYHRPNIHTYGFLNHASDTAKKILSQCAYLIFPSCSEGTSTSVINLIRNGGLIPVITEQTGLPKKDFIFHIEELSETGIGSAIEKATNISPEQAKEYGIQSYRFIKETYTLENHTLKMKESLKAVLNGA